MRLEEIISPFIHANCTCGDVIKYFSTENGIEPPFPKGPYYPLALYFINDVDKKNFIKGFIDENGKKQEPDKGDSEYKKWLKDIIEEWNLEKSIVLKKLSEVYTTKSELEEFVFLKGETDKQHPEYNQKWHFLISYWGYREFHTRHPEVKVNPKITKLTQKGTNYTADNRSPFSQCPEGKLWFNYCKEK